MDTSKDTSSRPSASETRHEESIWSTHVPAVGPPSKGLLSRRSLGLLLSSTWPPDTSPIRGVDGDGNLAS